MAITNYGELQDAVMRWIDREDVTDRVPEWVDMAMDRLSHALNAVDQEARSQRTVTAEWSALPLDFGGIRTIRDIDQGLPMTYLTPEELQQEIGLGAQPAVPMFTVEDMQLRIHPAPSEAAPLVLEIIYLQRLTTLANAADTNWVIEQAPSLAMAAVLVEAFSWMKDEERALFWDKRAADMIRELVLSSRRRRYPGGPLVIRLDGVI